MRDLFPEAFAEGKVDFNRLKTALGEAVDDGRERYGLSWAGKAEAIRNIQMPSTGTLVPVPEESVNFDTSENMIIEGDNLEVLKLLQKSYHASEPVPQLPQRRLLSAEASAIRVNHQPQGHLTTFDKKNH